MNKTPLTFFRIDKNIFYYSCTKVETKHSDTPYPPTKTTILFIIPRILPKAKEIAEHLINSVKHGDCGLITIGYKEIIN
jgi:hypothetical protein